MSTKILVADDSATMRKILELTFAGEDAEVLAVADGESAIRAADGFAPDVVLADASMPSPDGYEVAAALRGSVPVLVLVNGDAPYDAARGGA